MATNHGKGWPTYLGLVVALWSIYRVAKIGAAWGALYGLGIGILYLKMLEYRQMHVQEPPVMRHIMPYIGHLVQMLFSGSVYLKRLGSVCFSPGQVCMTLTPHTISRSNSSPIFTLPMPGSRLYIVTDPSLASAVQRATSTLSFSPLVPAIIERVAGFDKATIALMQSNMETGYIQQVQDAVHNRLKQGSYLDEISLDACNEFRRRLDLFDRAELKSSFANIELLDWIKTLVTMATATFFYGMNNPVESDPRLVKQFWDFDAGIPALLLGVAPSLTASKAYNGREAVVRALADYLRSPSYTETADVTKERSEIGRRMGVDVENIARSDLTFFFAGIINTSLNSFWMILNIFARPQLLIDVRVELNNIVTVDQHDAALPSLSVGDVARKCPLLHAVYREVLRLYSDNAVTRVVLKDTILADRYFLRKDSIIQVSGGIIHADERVWGSDASDFRPDRHLDKTASAKAPHAAAFRAFGGGATLCPGRHFALNEIMMLVALVILHFDIEGQDGRPLSVPTKDDKVLPIHVLEPVERVIVQFRRRTEWEKGMVTIRS